MAASVLILLYLASLSSSFSLPLAAVNTSVVAAKQNASGILQLSINKHVNSSPLLATLDALSERQVIDPTANTETGTLYMISMTIGTPPQQVTVQLDTGSSDLWVDPQCANAGSSSSVALCNSYPAYDPYSSSTAYDTGSAMSLEYGTGSCAGEYLVDTVSFGGATLYQQEFGWAQSSSSLRVGMMGISYGYGRGTNYYNVIDQLNDQGYIASRAFSLDLGNVDTSEGSIIFGGIDTKKYYGALEKRPIIPPTAAPDGFSRYWIYMTSVGISAPGNSSKVYTSAEYTQAVFLDSGGTLSRLPTNLVDLIAADFPGATYYGSGMWIVPCSYASMAGTVDFGFGKTTIHVPYSQFIWTAGTNICVLGVVATTDSTWVLGDTFLRAAFVVYDQDNGNLHLANAANCGTNVVAIGSGTDAVPSITGACSAPKSSVTASTSTKASKAVTKNSSAKTSSTKSSASSIKTSTTKKSTSTKISSSTKATSSPKTSSSTKRTSSSSKTSPSKSSSPTKTSSKKTSTSTSKGKRQELPTLLPQFPLQEIEHHQKDTFNKRTIRNYIQG